MAKKIDVVEKLSIAVGEEVGKFYDRLILSVFDTGAKYGYKYIIVPVYKYYRKIKYKEYCSCEECGNEHFNWRIKEIGVKQIGTKRIKVAKTFLDLPKKGRTIKFKRYSELDKLQTTGVKIILPKNTKIVKGLPKIDKKHLQS